MKKNLAFKLNYNDGGSDEKHIGYRGTCSNQTIKYNIKHKRPWCCNEECECLEFYADEFNGESPEGLVTKALL